MCGPGYIVKLDLLNQASVVPPAGPQLPMHVIKKLPQIEENNAKVKQQAAEPTPEVKPAAMSDELWQKITQLKKQSTEIVDSNSATDNYQSVSSQMHETASSFQNVDIGSSVKPNNTLLVKYFINPI